MLNGLDTPEGQQALAMADEQPDPGSLAAAQALRARFPADLAAAALTQAELRRRAHAKFGPSAAGMFFTRAGLEQATRPEVAAHHAARYVAAGVERVLDLGCGIGSDALAYTAAGLEVVAVELDPTTAAVARLNLRGRAEVRLGDAEVLAEALFAGGTAVFCDPSRRTGAGRVWRVEDFRPSWALVNRLLAGDRVAGVKLGPALPHALVPEHAEAEWVSAGGDTVEVALWAGAGARAGMRVATVLPDAELVVGPEVPTLTTAAPGRYLYEPDGAVIRAGGITLVGEQLRGWLLDPNIAYLSSDTRVQTPFATAFEVLEVLPYQERTLRSWVRAHDIGVLEILQRGIAGDPAQLRRRLQLRGAASSTLIVSRTPRGAVAMIARRVAPPAWSRPPQPR